MQLTNTLIGVARSNLEITANLIIIMADCVRMGDDVAALDYFKQVRDVLDALSDKEEAQDASRLKFGALLVAKYISCMPIDEKLQLLNDCL